MDSIIGWGWAFLGQKTRLIQQGRGIVNIHVHQSEAVILEIGSHTHAGKNHKEGERNNDLGEGKSLGMITIIAMIGIITIEHVTCDN